MPGEKVAALAANRVLFRDGMPVGAVVSGKTRLFGSLDASSADAVRRNLVKRGFDRPESAALVS